MLRLLISFFLCLVLAAPLCAQDKMVVDQKTDSVKTPKNLFSLKKMDSYGTCVHQLVYDESRQIQFDSPMF